MAVTASERKSDRLWPLVTLAAAGLCVHLHELAGSRPYFRDVHQIYVPAKHFLAERLRTGELPQWWPWDGAGSPLIPQPVFSVFHPTTLLYLVLPFWSAFIGQDLCATWMALFGAYALARAVGLPRAPAVIAGAIFGLNGYISCLSEHQFMNLSAGTMPWYVAAIVVAVRRGRAWLLLPALAMGLLLLAGDPQIAILSTVAGLVVALAWARRPLRGAIVAMVSPMLGAALAAVQVLPSLAILPDTERGHVMAPVQWTLTPEHLAGLFWPLDFGLTWVRSTVVGLAGMGLVLASLSGFRVPRRRRILAAWWALVMFSIWLAFGPAGGLHSVVAAVLPIWGRLRYPMKSMVLAYLALALLAGYGFVQLGKARLRVASVRWAIIPALLACIAFALRGGAGTTTLAHVALLASVVVFSWCRQRLAAVLVPAAMAAQALPLYLTIGPEYYDPPPVVQTLVREGVGLTGPAFDRPTVATINPADWSTLQVGDASAVTAELARLAALFDRAGAGGLESSMGALFGLPTVTPAMPGASWRALKLFDDAHRQSSTDRLLAVYGVGDVVLRDPVPPRLEPQVVSRDPATGYAVIQLRHRLDRAYSTARVRGVRDAEAAIEAVTSPQFRPGHEVIVEWAPSAEWVTRSDGPAIPAVVEPRVSANEVRLKATLPWPGVVVLNEAAFHGWTATVDGRAVPVLTANALVRAVEAPAGEHEVVFRFATPGLLSGAVISVLSAAAVAGTALLLSGAPRRRSRAT